MQYNKVTPEFIAELEKIVPGKVHTGKDINEDFFRDEMPIYGSNPPEAVVDATTTEDIAAIAKLCYDNSIPIIPRGAGTGLTGASVAIHGGVMIDMQKMNKILEYDEDNFVVRVQPGVLLHDLAEDALGRGLLYPAMTVVLPTGEIIKLGATVSKTSTGYNLLQLMIGSEGTLGIITEITLKVIPAPKETVSLIIPFENLDDCIATVPLFMKNRLNPQAVEFMEREIVLSSERFIGRETFPKQIGGVEAGAYLLVTFDGDDFDQLNDLVEKAAEVVLEEGAIDVLVADSPAKKRDAWAARSSFLEAIEAETKWLDECDVVVPVTKIAEYLKYVKSTEDRYCFKIKSFGHAGDGNLHIYACGDDTVDEATFKKDVEVFMKDIYAKAAEMGGLISGEHGIGHGKMEFLADFSGDAQMRIMEGIKHVFDPKMILNPGKVCYKVR